MLLSACGSSGPPPLPHRFPSNLQSIIEDQGLLQTNPAATLATFQRLGVDRVRVYVDWAQIAPDPNSRTEPTFDAADPAAYPAANWATFDEIIRDAAALRIGIDMTVGSPAPLWATGTGAPATSIHKDVWMPSAGDFGAFIRALGTRYSGRYVPPGASAPLPRVDFWSIWNEPNYGPYLAPQAIDDSKIEVSPRLYRGLLDAAWSALGATGHRPATDTILIGETAPRGINSGNHPGNFSGMVPLRFIRALYCVDRNFRPLVGTAAAQRGCPATASASASFKAENPALFEASGFADHPYQDALAPDDGAGDEPGDADFSALGDLERTLDRSAAAYGSDVQLPIYSTEFGYSSPTFVSGAQAAIYMNQAEYLSWLNKRIRSYEQYLLVDPPADSAFDTGLIAADGKPKPTLAAYRMPLWLPVTNAAAGGSLVVWGCVRPAPYYARITGRRQQVEVQFARAGGAFRTLRTVSLRDPHGYFVLDVKFPASGEVRLAWSGSGPTS